MLVCCGLLAKWLRVRVRVRIRAGASDCKSCISIFFFPCSVRVVNTFVFVSTVSTWRSAGDGLLMNIQ